MKRSPAALALLIVSLCAALATQLAASSAAKETWTQVRSKHFSLVGNAGEKDIRKVATRLEQFREMFSRLFPRANLNSTAPTTVVVFKNMSSYRPFMPSYQGKVKEVAGYFQPGEDVNYITLTAEFGQANPFSTIFHEYVHSLTSDNTRVAPLWFSEGLAEVYETFDVTDGEKKVWLGKPQSHHVYRLRETKFLPLDKLFAVDHASPDYNESNRMSIFYAESWALVHYLMFGNQQRRLPQFTQFLALLDTGAPVADCFRKAFQTDFAGMEKELRDYISRNTYPAIAYTLDEKLVFDSEMQSAPLGEAEAQFYLGDLAWRLRYVKAEEHLQKAIALDPNLAAAHASLGMMRTYQGRFAEAKQHLERAVALDTAGRNHLIYYYYARALSQEQVEANKTSLAPAFDGERARAMRAALEKAIQINPQFAESYSLLAFVSLVTGERVDESAALLRRALAAAPGKHELTFMLAQISLRQEKYDEARRLLEPLARDAAQPELRGRAKTLLDHVNNFTRQAAERKAQMEKWQREGEEAGRPRLRPREEAGGETGGEAKADPNAVDIFKDDRIVRRRFEGERVTGLLVRMDCPAKGNSITLHVKAEGGDARTLKLRSEAMDRVEFVTYTEAPGSMIQCGPMNPPRPVTVIYRASTDASSEYDGEPLAVMFGRPEQK
jgi:tetratricopeptide (TPR) repeat protein